MSDASPAASPRIAPPEAAALVVGAGRAHWLSADGEIEVLSLDEAAKRAGTARPLVCHRRATARRLGLPPFPAYDLLELFAFVRPARFCLPTPAGLAAALGLSSPADPAAAALVLMQASQALLAELAETTAGAPRAARLAMTMARAGWAWGPAALAALGLDAAAGGGRTGLDVWRGLPEFEETAPEPPPSEHAVPAEAAAERLAALLGVRAEARPGQVDYARQVSAAFAPRDTPGAPNLVLAEAGTGIGKTLGYIAPASLWAERNGGAVWISTYTKNLQRQIDQELDALYPDAADKAEKAVVRKGRENYLCLLNLEDAVGAGGASREGQVALALVARWAGASRDGDMAGGDFPAWLTGLFGTGRTLALTDRRGECIYSACPHYRKCFIEKVIRQARGAEIVIVNHALALIQATLGADEAGLPTRYVFDEGHHLFDAADSAFSADLSGAETAVLRRWLIGSEVGRRRGRARGLENRIGDLIAGEADAVADLEALVTAAAHVLPGEGWQERIAADRPSGPVESFLARVRTHVYARTGDETSPYSLEASTLEPAADLLAAAEALEAALARVEKPLRDLMRQLAELLDEEAATLDTAARIRIEAGIRGLERRGRLTLTAWRAMLRGLGGESDEAFVDWLGVERVDGRDVDVGMHRHWVDPTQPFAEAVLKRAHGVVVTSATLRDRGPEAPDDWQSAEVRTGALHLANPAVRVGLASPFDYAARTRVVVVTDVRRQDGEQVAAAYRELFLAAGGGALGLFTAIIRLRQVHRRIAGPLEAAGLPLLAQHVDPMDTGTLVDIFRAEVASCLLGTDAVRDGVDVPGRSLRLIVFDRVPWPRPDILHRARRAAFGGRAYDDMMTRLRLKQAYGRLVRGAEDQGVFVMLDAMLPTRLTTAFPDGVEIHRLGLADAISLTAGFLQSSKPPA
jgi:ATP-dependent DNA helicase DinG